jgi:hypothetical protein
MRSTSIWDKAETSVPTIDPNRPKLSSKLADDVVRYLRSATIVVRTTDMAPDVLSPEKGDCVNRSVFADGTYFWSASLLYYVEHYGLKPYSDFLRHIEANNFVPTEPTPDQISEVLEALGIQSESQDR